MKEFIDKLITRIMLESASCKVYKLINPNKEDIAEFNAYKKCIEIINELAEEYINTSTDTSSGWIPCSERLPEEPFGCLVTVMDCEPMTQTDFENILPYHVGYDGETWNDADGNVIPFEVIAWQPLPAPYKEGE